MGAVDPCLFELGFEDPKHKHKYASVSEREHNFCVLGGEGWVREWLTSNCMGKSGN